MRFHCLRTRRRPKLTKIFLFYATHYLNLLSQVFLARAMKSLDKNAPALGDKGGASGDKQGDTAGQGGVGDKQGGSAGAGGGKPDAQVNNFFAGLMGGGAGDGKGAGGGADGGGANKSMARDTQNKNSGEDTRAKLARLQAERASGKK